MRLTDRFDQAWLLASQLHRNQLRKATEVPYVAHLMSVTALVLEHGGNEDEAIAAMLHDCVEDQGGARVLETVRQTFGPEVAQLVADLSDTIPDNEAEAKPPWRPRKETYLAHLEAASPSVLLVSCADKLHNARSLLAELQRHGQDVWTLFRGGPEGTLWYFRTLVQIFQSRQEVPRELVKMLADTVDHIAQLGTVGPVSQSPPAEPVG